MFTAPGCSGSSTKFTSQTGSRGKNAENAQAARTESPTVILKADQNIEASTVGPIAVQITFSKAVEGFTKDGLQVTNGTVTKFTGSGSNYSVEITPNQPGTVTVLVPAAVAKDSNGNANVASLPISVTSRSGECTVKTEYNPSDIRCQISVDGPNVWTASDGWRELSSAFPDRAAKWISPLEAIVDNGRLLCPSVPSNEKLIYVSNVIIPHDGTYEVSVIVDNAGSFRMWKNASPASEAINISIPDVGRVLQEKVQLSQGFHSMIIEGHDFGIASAVIMSIAEADSHKVLKRSELSEGNWCIFRVNASTDPSTFVPKAGLCRKCFFGE